MYLVVREAERRFKRSPERRAQEGLAIVPATLMPGQWSNARPGELLGETEAMQDARGVRTDLNSGADLAQFRRLLVDVDVEVTAKQRQCRSKTANASSNDADRSSFA